jgi:hypothetical protein
MGNINMAVRRQYIESPSNANDLKWEILTRQ